MTHDERMHELLYSNEGRAEQCERICKLEGPVLDTMASCLALFWIANEHVGCEHMEPSSPATIRFRALQRRVRELEAPDA